MILLVELLLSEEPLLSVEVLLSVEGLLSVEVLSVERCMGALEATLSGETS